MSDRERELMERYIYQVVRRLPREQRREMSLELQELIGDMRETEPSMEAVLTRLGDPAVFARQYQDGRHYLIGPEYYDTYGWFVKIVLICTVVTVLVVSGLEGVREGLMLSGVNGAESVFLSAVYGIGGGLANLASACIGVFGGITLLFAAIERGLVKVDRKKEKQWNVRELEGASGRKTLWTPDYLSPVPNKKAVISRGDSIVSIVFLVIFCILLIFAPRFFSAVFPEGQATVVIPVFNLEQWNRILPFFLLSLLIGLGDEIFRLVAGHYCKPVMISSLVCGCLQLVLAFLVLKVFPFWNPDFAVQLQVQLGDQIPPALAGFLARWNGDTVSSILFAFLAVLTLIEMGVTVYKTLRYSSKSA